MDRARRASSSVPRVFGRLASSLSELEYGSRTTDPSVDDEEEEGGDGLGPIQGGRVDVGSSALRVVAIWSSLW